MVVGIRVVRGPDWNYGNNDGGINHVGTVAAIRGVNSVSVLWDSGNETLCRVGEGGKHDILVFDNATIGVRHARATCEACGEAGIQGTLWTCAECSNVHLCTPCYHDNEHFTNHEFNRIDLPGCEPVRLSRRCEHERSSALGIYPTSKVKRGRDWEYGNQDGGAGKEGIVEDLVSFRKDSSNRNAVRVQWGNKERNTYRVGYLGKMDLICVKAAPGAEFYKDHLAKINLKVIEQWERFSVILKVGDKVFVHLPKETFRAMQKGRSDWVARMEECIGDIGEVESYSVEGDIYVKYDGEKWRLNPATVTKVPDHAVGDSVRIMEDKDTLKLLQKKRAGWDEEILEVCGKIGKITAIDRDGDVGVTFEDKSYVFHPGCLIPVSGQGAGNIPSHGEMNEEQEDQQSESGDVEGEEEGDDGDIGAALGLLMKLALLETLQSAAKTEIAGKFCGAVLEGDEETVKKMLSQSPGLKDILLRGVAPLHLAAHKGHISITRILLDAGANLEVKDIQGENTPFMFSLDGENEELALFFIDKGADVFIKNKLNRTALHFAAFKNLAKVIKVLLDRGVDINIQDIEGDTPLHDAINQRHDTAAALLIQHQSLDMSICNNKGFNTLMFAVLKGHALAVDKLLGRNKDLTNTSTSEGFTPLHIAAVNNHLNEANFLLVKGRANVNKVDNNKMTPLHLAALEAYFDMVKLLLTHGASWEVQDKDGNTPLHLCMAGRRRNNVVLALFGLRSLAEDNERVTIAELLIQHGASLEVMNSKGLTPLMICINERLRQTVQTFAENNKVKIKLTERPNTAKVAEQIFKQSKLPCYLCKTNTADVRFKPCGHKVTCRKCSPRYKRCPVCEQEVTQKFGLDDKPVQTDSCCIQ
ncbi:hypothetical protein CHS0354_035781 [Potamilus streckersoni]|uniref:RING-type E3 ubiquitin transferase n=1 Tax=Potamilus streckersoni TaxID=2493646 RepID=A0AAE0SWW7_9BIVA|nr:hypothetical protein CHS0354_035781 [Potamilus streckersoni]